MLLRTFIIAAIFMAVWPNLSRTQVPDVQGTCVYGCGSGGGVSEARQRQLDRNHARHAREVGWFNEVERRYMDARKRGADLSKKGARALEKGDCAAAISYFQQEQVAFNIDLTPRGQIVDAILNGKWYGMYYGLQNVTSIARGRIAGAQATCVARQPPVRTVMQSPSANGAAPSSGMQGQPAPKQSAVLAAYASRHPKIGAASRIKGEVYWLTDRGVKVLISDGTPLYLGQRIVTGEDGRFQLLLLDETVFTLGPLSDMALDEFVYDPNTTIGKITANVVKGTFRFVTGKITHKDPDQIRVKLPVAALGIRGTDFTVKYEPGAPGYIALAKGSLQITPNVGSPFAMTAGEKATIQSDGTVIPPGAARLARSEGSLVGAWTMTYAWTNAPPSVTATPRVLTFRPDGTFGVDNGASGACSRDADFLACTIDDRAGKRLGSFTGAMSGDKVSGALAMLFGTPPVTGTFELVRRPGGAPANNAAAAAQRPK